MTGYFRFVWFMLFTMSGIWIPAFVCSYTDSMAMGLGSIATGLLFVIIGFGATDG